MQRVLECLWKHKLYLKPEKCEFERKWIEYLGVIVLEGLVEMDPIKVSGVVEWPVPWKKKEVQSFVGFINLYQRFIKDSPTTLTPCSTLPKKTLDGDGERWNRLPLTS